MLVSDAGYPLLPHNSRTLSGMSGRQAMSLQRTLEGDHGATAASATVAGGQPIRTEPVYVRLMTPLWSSAVPATVPWPFKSS